MLQKYKKHKQITKIVKIRASTDLHGKKRGFVDRICAEKHEKNVRARGLHGFARICTDLHGNDFQEFMNSVDFDDF